MDYREAMNKCDEYIAEHKGGSISALYLADYVGYSLYHFCHVNPDATGSDRNCYFVVNSHPGLTDLFVKQARREYLLIQPLSKEDIHYEAAKILGRLQDAREPNSPGGTHFVAEISPDFMLRAKSKDTEKLSALLPFQSLSLSTLDGRKGVFAIISKDENRSQPLRERKPSVLKKLKENTPSTSSPKKQKVAKR